MEQQNMPIDPNSVQWDTQPKIDPNKVKWDAAPSPTTTPVATKDEPDNGWTAKDAALSAAFGGPEAGLNMLSGMIAKPASDVVGLADLPKQLLIRAFGGEDDPTEAARLKKTVQDALTYEPKTKGGKVAAEYNPLALLGKAVDKTGDVVGDAVGGGKDTSIERQAAGNFAREGVKQLAGFVLPKVAGKVGEVAGKSADAAKAGSAEKAAQTVRENQVRKQSADAGYEVPASQASKSAAGTVHESLGGGATKAERAASDKAQTVTNGLVKKTLGIADEKPISKETLAEVRTEAGKAYKEIEQWPAPFQKTAAVQQTINSLNQQAKFLVAAGKPEVAAQIRKIATSLDKQRIPPEQAMFNLQDLREEARANRGSAERAGGDVVKERMAKAQSEAAKALESMIEENLTAGGEPQMAANFKAAREKIAQTYTVEDALNPSTGEVSARKLFDAIQRGDMVGGGMKTAADFAGAFPKSARPPSESGSHAPSLRGLFKVPFVKGTSTPQQLVQPTPAIRQAIATLTNQKVSQPAIAGSVQQQDKSQ